MKSILSSTTNKIRVLDLRDSPWVDGPGRTILDCASSIESEQYHFVIGTFGGGMNKNNAYAKEALRRGLEVVVIPERRSFDLQVIRNILRIIDEKNINLIHTHDFRSNIYGLFCAKKRKIPLISTTHGWIANDLKGKLYTIIDKILLRFFNKIIAVSERTKRIVNAAFIQDKKITIINNALITEQYLIDKNDQTFRYEIGAKDDTVLIANIGRLSPEKGQLIFLESAREVLKSHSNVKFILIGIGSDEGILRDFVKNNSMDDFVVFAGFRHDMISIYNSLDLIVQSSYTEGMPNVVLEALLMKVPVIATNVGGTSNIISSGETGILIKAGSKTDLVHNINHFLENPEEYKNMRKNGRELILNKFDHAKRAEKLRLLYDEVIDFQMRP